MDSPVTTAALAGAPEPGPVAAPQPVRGWTRAARILGMSDDALAAKRKKYGDRTREPWWRDADAVRAWFEALIAPPPLPERKPRPAPKPRPADGPLDLDALRSEVR